jgi:hypothetical protein
MHCSGSKKEQLMWMSCVAMCLWLNISIWTVEQIIVKCDMEDFHEMLSGSTKYKKNLTNVISTLHEDHAFL